MTMLARNILPAYIYYRQPNGWISPAVATDVEMLQYQKEGWQPLRQYGRFDMNSTYGANHPLEALFIRGGALELPLEQILEEGFYMNVPLIPSCGQVLTQYHNGHSPECWMGAQSVQFPQLEGVLVEGPFPCRICGEKKATSKGRENHEEVAHKAERGDIRTGTVLAEALVQGLKGAPAVPSGSTPTLQRPAMPYLCGFCNDGFKSPIGLGKHVKEEHKSAHSEITD